MLEDSTTNKVLELTDVPVELISGRRDLQARTLWHSRHDWRRALLLLAD